MSDFQNRIIAALRRKAPPAPHCPVCGVSDWAIQGGVFYHRESIRTEWSVSSSGSSLPCAAMVCKNCGNTHFLSLSVLDPDLLKDFR